MITPQDFRRLAAYNGRVVAAPTRMLGGSASYQSPDAPSWHVFSLLMQAGIDPEVTDLAFMAEQQHI